MITKKYSPENIQEHFNEIDNRLRDNPTSAIKYLLRTLRDFISCETICLLLWNENKQKLVTEYKINLPEKMGPEEYEYDQGLTGSYIFSSGKTFKGIIDCENRKIFNQLTNSYVDDKNIKWTNILAFKKKSKFRDFKSMIGFPFIATRQWRGVLKCINKINSDGNLHEKGFTNYDLIFLLRNFLQKLEHIIAIQVNNNQIKNILSLQEFATKQPTIPKLLKEVVDNCVKTLNYKVCSARIFKDGKFEPPVSNSSFHILDEVEDEELFSEKPDELNFRRRVVWSKQGSDFPKQTYKNKSIELKYFPQNIRKFISINWIQSYMSIPIQHQGDFFGILEFGTKLPQKITNEDINSATSFANALALVLVNIRRSENLEKMASLTSRLVNKEDIKDIYKTILDHVVNDIGFDYAVLSRVNHAKRTVRIIDGKSVYQNLVDPNQWKELASYSFDKKDILVYLATNPNPKIITIISPEDIKKWKNWLNPEIYKTYDHKNLIRVFVPIIFQNPVRKERPLVVSIIEAGYHISHQTTIPEHQIELVNLFGNFAESIYKALSNSDSKSVDRMFQIINSPRFPIEPMSDSDSIYENLIKIICDYMGTDAVSIWEKVLVEGDYKLNYVKASKVLEAAYKQEAPPIKSLPKDCYTFDAVRNPDDQDENLNGALKNHDYVVRNTDNGVIFVNEKGLNSEHFAYSTIPLEMGFKGMICVPMKIGKEIYSAITIFIRSKSVSKGEEEALSILADRVAVAVQSAKIIESFRVFSEVSPDENIDTTLGKIAESSRLVLHASSVVLFRYQDGKFSDSLVEAGNVNYKWNRSINPVTIKENDLPNRIIQKGSYYFDNEKKYEDYVKKNNIDRMNKQHKQGFWYRENLKSSAVLRLEVKRISGDDITLSYKQLNDDQNKIFVGVMFINYQAEQNFKDSQLKGLMNSFALLAATAIYNAYLLEHSKKLWEIRRGDDLGLSVNEIVSGIAHDSGNLVSAIKFPFYRFIDDFLNKKYKDKTHIEKAVVMDELISQIKEPLDELNADFIRLRNYRKFYHKLEAKPHKIISLVKDSLDLLHHRFVNQDIYVDTKSMQVDAWVVCDSNQIQHLFLNLFINAADAMGRRGTLSLGTEIKGGFIIVRVSDDGKGVPYELFDKIFQPRFTTKNQPGETGTGMGLPISKYIAETHGGQIAFKRNSDLRGMSKKGMSFFVHIPIDKEHKK